ncbi:MAG: serine/threonine protein kinase [Gemmatimonadales bacterium]|nr:MAG: serine/threonine protein kinase [Gemmatimonadales bacterium]
MDDPMAPSPQWERISELFLQALELHPEERVAFLAREAGDDPPLRDRVVRLLASHEAAEGGSDRLDNLFSGLEAGRAAFLLRYEDPAPGDDVGPSPESAAAVPAPDPWGGPVPGDMVGQYRILRRLGRGGMGAVYEAHDPVLDRVVALKFLMADGVGPDRLLEEARSAAALDHPGVGTIHEVGTDGSGRPFMAMARYSGGTLRDRLRHGPVAPGEVVRIGVQVAEALGAAHARGILHLDVKPENLLFDEAGQVKVVDFGIARVGGPEEPPQATAGTLAYMSPERLEGRPVDGRADLWALGMVLVEALLGRHPLRELDRADLVRAIRSGAYLTPRGSTPSGSWSSGVGDAAASLPSELSRVLEGSLALDPEDRPLSGEALAHRLRTALEPTLPAPPTAPPPVRPTEPGQGLASRRVALAAAGLVLILALVAGLAIRQSPRLLDATGFAGEAFAPREQVLVTDFQAGTGLGDLALATREALVVDLQQSGFVRVVARGRIEETLRRMEHPEGIPLHGALALEVAERLGAGAVLETSVARVGTRYILSGRALDPRSGEELFAVRTSGGERRLLGAVERLSREVRLRLGEASESLAGSRPLPQVTTGSLEALRLYALAERAMAEDVGQVIVYLNGALELDPEFAMAHRLAAAAGINRMRFEDATRHLRLAWEYRDRLPDRERWLVEAAHASETRYDPFIADELYRRIVARFPDERIAWSNLGNNRASWLADPEGALVAFVRALELEPETLLALPSATQLALVLGRLEQADALMAQADRPGFEGQMARWRVARAFWLDDAAEVVAACHDLLTGGYPPVPQADPREVCGSMLLIQGDRERALPLLVSALDDYTRLGSYRNLASILQSLAVADLMVGDTLAARARFTQALELADPNAFGEPDRYIYRSNLQIHAGLLGWTDLVDEIGGRYPPLADPDHLLGRGGKYLVEAALAVARGDGEAALTSLEEAFPPGVMAMGWRVYDEILRARALELLGEADLAAVHYREAADRGWAGFPGLTKDRLLIPEALAGLARVSGGTTP